MNYKFKVGDKVRVKEYYECASCSGKLLKIISVNHSTSYPINTITEGGDREIFNIKALYLSQPLTWRDKICCQ